MAGMGLVWCSGLSAGGAGRVDSQGRVAAPQVVLGLACTGGAVPWLSPNPQAAELLVAFNHPQAAAVLPAGSCCVMAGSV